MTAEAATPIRSETVLMLWLRGALSELPLTLTTEQAAPFLGVSRDHLYALHRKGEAPIEPLQLGRKLMWPTMPLLRLLGIEPADVLAAERGPDAPVAGGEKDAGHRTELDATEGDHDGGIRDPL